MCVFVSLFLRPGLLVALVFAVAVRGLWRFAKAYVYDRFLSRGATRRVSFAGEVCVCVCVCVCAGVPG